MDVENQAIRSAVQNTSRPKKPLVCNTSVINNDPIYLRTWDPITSSKPLKLSTKVGHFQSFTTPNLKFVKCQDDIDMT